MLSQGSRTTFKDRRSRAEEGNFLTLTARPPPCRPLSACKSVLNVVMASQAANTTDPPSIGELLIVTLTVLSLTLTNRRKG